MATVHFSTIPWEPNTANRHIESHILFGKFIPVLSTLCMLGLKFLKLLHFLSVFSFCMLRIMGKGTGRNLFVRVDYCNSQLSPLSLHVFSVESAYGTYVVFMCSLQQLVKITRCHLSTVKVIFTSDSIIPIATI